MSREEVKLDPACGGAEHSWQLPTENLLALDWPDSGVGSEVLRTLARQSHRPFLTNLSY